MSAKIQPTVKPAPIAPQPTGWRSWFSSLFSGEVASAEKAGVTITAKGVNALGVTVSVGQIVSALKALPTLEKALSNLVHGTAHMADYETIGLDTLSAFAVIDPEYAPQIGIIVAVAPFLIGAVETGVIKPDQDPEVDAQTSRNFQPGDPAARL